MSIHCLICGHQGHWIPNEDDEVKECKEDNNTWTRMVLFKEYGKRPIEQWYIHTACLKRWIEARTEAECKLKDKTKYI